MRKIGVRASAAGGRHIVVGLMGVAALGLGLPVLADGKAPAKKKPTPKPRYSQVDVGYTGSGSFKQVDIDAEGYGVTITGSFNWDVGYRKVTLIRDAKGKVTAATPAVPIDLAQSKGGGSWTATVRTKDGDGDCTGSGGFTLPGAGSKTSAGNGGGIQLTQTGSSFKVALDVASAPELQTTGGGDGATACTPSDLFGAVTGGHQVGSSPDGSFVDPLHTSVDGLAFGEHLTRSVGADASQKKAGDSGCGLTDGSVCTFDFDWHGQVTADPACDEDFGVTTRRATLRSAKVCEAVSAKLADPSATTRGQNVTLDASASGPKKAAIKKYQFMVAPAAGCPAGTHLAHTVITEDDGKASKVRFKILCPITARVKVTDKDGNTATSDPVTAEVKARKGKDWKATVDRATESTFKGSFEAPTGVLMGGGIKETWNTTFGENFGAPGHIKTTQHGSILKPYNALTFKNDGYDADKVDDPKGPFDGFWWVKSTTIGIDRLECVNPYLTPKGPKPPGATENWYAFNKRKGIAVDALLAATRAHEGLGIKADPKLNPAITPGVGHTGVLKARLEKDDPRAKLETMVQGDKFELYNEADKYLLQLDSDLAKATEDGAGRTIDGQPAATYTGDYWVFIPANGSWVKVSGSL